MVRLALFLWRRWKGGGVGSEEVVRGRFGSAVVVRAGWAGGAGLVFRVSESEEAEMLRGQATLRSGAVGAPCFLITGGALSRNLGSAAMVLGTIELARRKFPGCRVCVLSTRYGRDRLLYPAQEMEHDSRTSFRGVAVLGRALIWRLRRLVLGKDLTRLLGNGELAAYCRADLVIDVSGDGLTEDYGPLVLGSHCIPILVAKCLGKPVVLLGQTVGPFTWSRPVMRWILGCCDWIGAREDVTYRYLERLGVAAGRLRGCADMAFLLEAGDRRQAELVEAESGYNPKERLTLGMTVSQQYVDFLEGRRRGRTKDEVLATLARVVDGFVEAHDGQVVLFAHVTGPPERLDDRVIARRLRSHCRRADRVVVVNRELEPGLMKALIGRCGLFCGARMHSNIAALSSLVPTIALAYSVKSRGIMGRLGMQEWVVEMETLTAEGLLGRLNRLLAEMEAVREKLRGRVPKEQEAAVASVEAIGQLLVSREPLTSGAAGGARGSLRACDNSGRGLPGPRLGAPAVEREAVP